jgi:NAD+ synthase (glutamine-hydrolysing)
VPVVRVALCQLNITVGALDANVAAITDALEQAEAAGADIAVFPELSITGYPPEDLLLKPGFIADNIKALNKVVRRTKTCAAAIGFVERGLYNSAVIARDGKRAGVYRKRHLPNYAVFDEQRYFKAGRGTYPLYEIAGVRVGVSVCEDAWIPEDGPIAKQGRGGAELIVNLNASPYYAGRLVEREAVIAARAREAGCPVVYVNQVGGQDELVFDGGSMVFDGRGELVHRIEQFDEAVSIVDIDVPKRAQGALKAKPVSPPSTREAIEHEPSTCRVCDVHEEIWQALVVGTRDYVRKNGFTDVVIAMSGGIDSSVVAVIAVDALGAQHVHGISMPSRYSSDHSKSDAQQLAERLGIDYRTIPIEPAHTAFQEMLAPSFGEREPNITDENLQSRIRGMVNMAFTNEKGWLTLTTGNKSEMAVGYYTLYGDSAGDYGVIKDVFKTELYELVKARNAREPGDSFLIDEAIITKPPSAELRPDQRDDQSLPPYDVLDPILEAFVERDMTRDEIVDAGHDPAIVDRIVRLVDLAEHKRRQSPPGVRVSVKAFGKDRRMPITNGYR